MKTKSLLSYLGGAIFALPALSFGQIFADGLDTAASSGLWNVQATQDTDVIFGWDYSALGIPAAPNGTGTTGVRMAANMSSGTVSGLSMTPIGLTLPTNYTVKFDMWINANGPFPAGGAGSTEFGTFGVGATGGEVQWSGAAGQTLGVSGEGGSSIDYRIYNAGVLAAADSGVYAAGTDAASRNNTHAYYTTAFPGQSPPAAQQSAFVQQSGTLADGTQGFAWREVEVRVMGATVEWSIDGTLIATVNNFNGSGDPFIGYYDPFTSVSDNSDLSFGVYDNFQVIPEPSTYAAIFGGLALLGALGYRRRKVRA